MPRGLFAFRGSKWMGSCPTCHQGARGCALMSFLVPITGQGLREPSVSSYEAGKAKTAVSKGYVKVCGNLRSALSTPKLLVRVPAKTLTAENIISLHPTSSLTSSMV